MKLGGWIIGMVAAGITLAAVGAQASPARQAGEGMPVPLVTVQFYGNESVLHYRAPRTERWDSDRYRYGRDIFEERQQARERARDMAWERERVRRRIESEERAERRWERREERHRNWGWTPSYNGYTYGY